MGEQHLILQSRGAVTTSQQPFQRRLCAATVSSRYRHVLTDTDTDSDIDTDVVTDTDTVVNGYAEYRLLL